jgi:hypothetical protein
MQMAFLQAQVHHPKTTIDYKKTSFEFDVKEVHPVDQMDMHRQIGEIIFSTRSTSNKTGLFTGFLCQIVGDVSLSLLNVFLFSVIIYVFQILIIKRKSIEHNLSCILCLWSFNGLYVFHLKLSKGILSCSFA